MIRASISPPLMYPSIGAPALSVALAELEDLVVETVDPIVVGEDVVEEFLDAVVGKRGVPNSIVVVGEVSGPIVTVTLTTVESANAGVVVGPKGSGGAHIPGCGVSHPESWIIVGVKVTLDAVVVKVPTIIPLGTSAVIVVVADDSIWFKAGSNGASCRRAWIRSFVIVEALLNEQNLLQAAVSVVPPMPLAGWPWSRRHERQL